MEREWRCRGFLRLVPTTCRSMSEIGEGGRYGGFLGFSNGIVVF